MKLFTTANVSEFLQYGYNFCHAAAITGNTCDVMVYPALDEDIKDQLVRFADSLNTPEWEELKNCGLVGLATLDPMAFIGIYEALDFGDYDAFYNSIRFLLAPRYFKLEPTLVLNIRNTVDGPAAVEPIYKAGVLRDEDGYVNSDVALYLTPEADDFVKALLAEFAEGPDYITVDTAVGAIQTAYDATKSETFWIRDLGA